MYFVVDDFLSDPDKVRQDALNSEFIDWEAPDGQVYRRICIKDIPEALGNLAVFFNREVDLLGMAYRLNLAGEKPNQSIHTDLYWGTWAMILYLSEGEGGTAFWKHKATGRRTCFPHESEFILSLEENNDWEDESKWELDKLVEMKYNRALIMESALFHSRYPFEAFGKDGEDGRLIAVAFFN